VTEPAADEGVAWAPLRAALIAWYDRSARDLPWRRTRDPYAIWVSEIMLQQTRVETVVRYYDRFLQRFPTPHALAAAGEDEVMAAWSGLGYYRRARNLHSGVREVVARYGGRVPEAPEARRALPGVGRYTAGAIGSIAFEREEPIVDGNVARVLCRVLDIQTPLSRPATQARLWHAAERLVRGPRPSALNQALMELGATVCSKQNPRCASCPLRDGCRAHAAGRAHALPVLGPRRAAREVALVALVATRARAGEIELFLGKGDGTLFGGLWNLPMLEGRGRAAARELLRRSGLRARLPAQAPAEIEHVLTHRRLALQLWRVEHAQPTGGHAATDTLRPVRLHELDALGVSALTRKALTALGLGSKARART
jgi:A/G-specific adenine glycosylase